MRWHEITEVFDFKSVDWISLGHHTSKCRFSVGDQEFIGIFEPNSQDDGAWHFAFMAKTSDNQNPSSVENTGMQGSRSLQVFGYVVSAIEEFIEEISPNEITFGADKSAGKDQLYLSMAKKLKGRVGHMGYRIAYEEDDGAAFFTIEKSD